MLRAIDEFGRTRKYLINVGEDKGMIVVDLIREHKPQTMIKLGGCCGYSTILFCDAGRRAGGKKYYSLERSPKSARSIEILVELAGLKDIVEVIVGPSNECIKRLHSKGLQTVEPIVLNYYKPAETTDIKLCEQLESNKKGTVLAADNVIAPGNPPYLEYVGNTVEEKRTKLTKEAKLDTESFSDRYAATYEEIEKPSKLHGNPSILLSTLIPSFEPTGEPLSQAINSGSQLLMFGRMALKLLYA